MEFFNSDSTDGPIYIGKDALVMEGCLIRGPFALGDGGVLKMGTRVYGASSLGPGCTGAGEIKNALMMSWSNKAHDGFLGDSIVGNWCNLGGGTSNSNLKNNVAPVKLWNPLLDRFTEGGAKCGLMMGDFSRSAINTSFNTGTVVGTCAHVFGNGLTPTFIPSFSWGFSPLTTYHFDKAIRDLQRWMAFKNKSPEDVYIRRLKSIFDEQKNPHEKTICRRQLENEPDYPQGAELLKAIVSAVIELSAHQYALFAVPFPYLELATDSVDHKKNFFASAQNCSDKKSGAYTGEVSAEMLHSVGISYCLVGHSERREYFNETDAVLAAKLVQCLGNGITPVFCCGEPLPVREKEGQNAYVEAQLAAGLFALSA